MVWGSMSWDSEAAEAYAQLRTFCEGEGTPLGTMDMLIAAHSVAVGAILVTNDQAFFRVKHLLSLEDWTRSHDPWGIKSSGFSPYLNKPPYSGRSRQRKR